MGKGYRKVTKNCEVCGKEFSRSSKPGHPPRFCSQACLNKWRVGKSHVKYPVDEHWLPIIERTYREANGNDGSIKKLAKKIGVPRTRLYTIAKQMGWVKRERPLNFSATRYWSHAELQIMETNGHKHPATIHKILKRRGFNRSVASVWQKRTELRAGRLNADGMSASDMALCMGVDVHNIMNAIKNKKLQAERWPGYEYEKAPYYISPKAAQQYIQTWLPEINIAKCDKYWLVDLLATAA